MSFAEAFRIVVKEEGVLSMRESDPGNWTGGKVGKGVLKGTKYGISAGSYPDLDIKNLSLAEAKAIYWTDYWSPVGGEKLPWPWALPAFDCAVNQGLGIAKRLMQDALGVMVDGDLGPRTLAAAAASTDRQLARFFALRALRYEKTFGFAENGFGWFTRLFIIAQEARKEL